MFRKYKEQKVLDQLSQLYGAILSSVDAGRGDYGQLKSEFLSNPLANRAVVANLHETQLESFARAGGALGWFEQELTPKWGKNVTQNKTVKEQAAFQETFFAAVRTARSGNEMFRSFETEVLSSPHIAWLEQQGPVKAEIANHSDANTLEEYFTSLDHAYKEKKLEKLQGEVYKATDCGTLVENCLAVQAFVLTEKLPQAAWDETVDFAKKQAVQLIALQIRDLSLSRSERVTQTLGAAESFATNLTKLTNDIQLYEKLTGSSIPKGTFDFSPLQGICDAANRMAGATVMIMEFRACAARIDTLTRVLQENYGRKDSAPVSLVQPG